MTPKEKVIVRAQELQIVVPDNATQKEIEALIIVAEHPILVKSVEVAAEQLEGQKEVVEKAIEDKEAAVGLLALANETINELTEKLKDALADPKKEVGVVYKSASGDEYEFAVKTFRFKGEKYKAEEAVDNKDLMESLIKAAFVNLKKI